MQEDEAGGLRPRTGEFVPAGTSCSSLASHRSPVHGVRPLILDRARARRLRQTAAAAGRESGHDRDGSIATWVWSDRNWTPHRYRIHLSVKGL